LRVVSETAAEPHVAANLVPGHRPSIRYRRRRRRLRPLLVVKYVVLVVLTLVVAYPLVWIAWSALRSGADLALHPFSFPSALHLSNYIDVFKNGFDIDILNSLWICLLSTIGVTIVTALAAYPLSRMRWKLRKWVAAYFGFGLLVPVYAALIPLYLMLHGIAGHIGSRLTLAIVYLAVGIPVSIVLLMGYMSKVPREIEEAAVVDGCTTFQVLWRIVLPVAAPGVGVSATFTFITMWNELLFALVFLTYPHQDTIPVGLQQYVGTYSSDWPAELAAISLAVIPTLIIYLFLQRRLMAGVLSAGGIN
jgi:raffinose/stachyose/melibiose transport system permease protein